MPGDDVVASAAEHCLVIKVQQSLDHVGVLQLLLCLSTDCDPDLSFVPVCLIPEFVIDFLVKTLGYVPEHASVPSTQFLATHDYFRDRHLCNPPAAKSTSPGGD